MRNARGKSSKVILHSDIDFGFSQGGTAYASFLAISEDAEKTMIKYVAFKQLAEEMSRLLKKGMKISISSFTGDRGDPIVTGYYCDELNKLDIAPIKISPLDKKEHKLYMERNGKVPTELDGKIVYQRKQDCILIQGKWKLKIDALMDAFGAKAVNEKIKEIYGAAGLTDPQKAKEYSDWKEGMLGFLEQ